MESPSEYRHRTVARIIDKRRELNNQTQKAAEDERTKDSNFRVQWRANVKKKRGEMVTSQVDEMILRNTIRNFPEVLLGDAALAAEKKQVLDLDLKPGQSLDDLVPDLTPEESMELPMEEGKSVFASDNIAKKGYVLHRSGQNSQPSLALQFLQNSITFKLAVNKRLKAQQSVKQTLSRLANSGGSDEAKYGPSVDIFNRANYSCLHGSLRNHSFIEQKQKQKQLSQSEQHLLHEASRGAAGSSYSSFENETQVHNLVRKLVMSTTGMSTQMHSAHTGQITLFNEDNPMHSTAGPGGRRIKTTGLMSKILHETAENRLRTRSESRLRTQSNASEMPSREFMSPLQRTNSFFTGAYSAGRSRAFSDATAVTAVSGAAGGGGKGIGGVHPNLSAANGPSHFVEGVEIEQSGGFFTSLVDNVFLIGPSSDAIEAQIQAHATISLSASSSNKTGTVDNPSPRIGGGAGTGIDGGSAKTEPFPEYKVTDFSSVLEPTIMFMTECDNPEETLTLLPSYCFPRYCVLILEGSVWFYF